MSIKFGNSPKTCLGTKVSAHFMVLGLDGSIRMAILISQSSYGSSQMFQTLLIAFFTLKFLSINKPVDTHAWRRQLHVERETGTHHDFCGRTGPDNLRLAISMSCTSRVLKQAVAAAPLPETQGALGQLETQPMVRWDLIAASLDQGCTCSKRLALVYLNHFMVLV